MLSVIVLLVLLSRSPLVEGVLLGPTTVQLHARNETLLSTTKFVSHSSQMTLASYMPTTFPIVDPSSTLHHGRGVVTGVPKVYMILIGGWNTTEVKYLDNFMVGFATSDWLRHLNWASDMAQSFAYRGYWLITDATAIQADSNGNPVLDPIMQLYAPTDPAAIYVILTNDDAGLVGCGFHSGITLKDGSTPNLIWGNRNAGCNDGHLSLPTGDNTFDSMGSIVAHEMAELFTDPYPNNGQGVAVCPPGQGCSEVADICSSLPSNTQIDTVTGAYYNADFGSGGKWQLQDALGIVGYQQNGDTIVGCQAGATTMGTLLQGQYLTEDDTLTSYNKAYKLEASNNIYGIRNQKTGVNVSVIAPLTSSHYWMVLDPSGYLILYDGAFPNTSATVWQSNAPPGEAFGPYWVTLTNTGQMQLMNSYGIIWESKSLPGITNSPTAIQAPASNAPTADPALGTLMPTATPTVVSTPYSSGSPTPASTGCPLVDPKCNGSNSRQPISSSPSSTVNTFTTFPTLSGGSFPHAPMSTNAPTITNTPRTGIPTATFAPSFSTGSSSYAPTATSSPTPPINNNGNTYVQTVTSVPAPSFTSRSNAPTASLAPATHAQITTLAPTREMPSYTWSPTSATQNPAGSFSVTALRVACETFPCPYNHEDVQYCHVQSNGGKVAYCVSADIAFMFLADNAGDYCGPCDPM